MKQCDNCWGSEGVGLVRIQTDSTNSNYFKNNPNTFSLCQFCTLSLTHDDFGTFALRYSMREQNVNMDAVISK